MNGSSEDQTTDTLSKSDASHLEESHDSGLVPEYSEKLDLQNATVDSTALMGNCGQTTDCNSEKTKTQNINANAAPLDCKGPEEKLSSVTKGAPRKRQKAAEENQDSFKSARLNSSAVNQDADFKSEPAKPKGPAEFLCNTDRQNSASERDKMISLVYLKALVSRCVSAHFNESVSKLIQSCQQQQKLLSIHAHKIAMLEGEVSVLRKAMREMSVLNAPPEYVEKFQPRLDPRNVSASQPLISQNILAPEQIAQVGDDDINAFWTSLLTAKRDVLLPMNWPTSGSSPYLRTTAGVIDLTNDNEVLASVVPPVEAVVAQSSNVANIMHTTSSLNSCEQNGLPGDSKPCDPGFQQSSSSMKSLVTDDGSLSNMNAIPDSTANNMWLAGSDSHQSAAAKHSILEDILKSSVFESVVPVKTSTPGDPQNVNFGQDITNIASSMSNTNTPDTTNSSGTLDIAAEINPVQEENTVTGFTSAMKMHEYPVAKHPAPVPPQRQQDTQPFLKETPPKPLITIVIEENNIPVLSWDIETTGKHAYITHYELYAYQETAHPPKSSLWKKFGTVPASSGSMKVNLTKMKKGCKYHITLRAIDVHGRVGPCGDPVSVSCH